MAQDLFASSPELDIRKRWALMQLQGAADSGPVRHPLQAVARALQGAMGGYLAGQAEQEDKAAGAAMFNNLPGISAPPTQLPPAQPQASMTSPMGALPGMVAEKAIQYGVDPNYAVKTASLESSMNPNPRPNPNSSAAGLFQFTKGTASQYGLTNPNDPEASADAAMRFARDNAAILTPKLGRPPTNGELYLAHQQGAGGALALLSNPNANVIDALAPAYGGDRSKANAAVVNNGGSPAQTAGDFASRWTSRFDGQPGQQLAQAGPAMQPSSQAPARSQLNIPPEVAATIQRLGADPRTRPQAWQLYLQYAKPIEQVRPMTAEERKAYGVPEGVAASLDQVTGKPNYSQPGVNVALNTEKKGQEYLAQKAIEGYDTASNAARDSQRRIGVYDRMEKAAEGFAPGATANLRLDAQRYLNELGIKVNDKMSEGEVMRMLGQQLSIHAQPKGQGAVSNYEREMFAKSLPNIMQSPEGFKKAIGINRALEQYDINVAKIWRESARKNGGIPNYLEVQDKIQELGSPLTDSQMSLIQGGQGQDGGSSIDDLVKKYGGSK